jgi:chromosomal replication initiation ATPase DnaA
MAVARQSVENLPSAKPRWPPIPRHLFKMKRDAAAKLAAERSKENKIALQALRVDASGIIRRIIIECAREWKSTPAEIISRRRAVVSVEPRFMAIYLAHALTVLSLSHIGREFACRERTTIMYSIDRAKAMLDSDPELAARVEAIKAAVVGGGEA